MKHLVSLVLALALMLPAVLVAEDSTPPVESTAKKFDYSNMTPADIEELQAQRHAFYEAENEGRDALIKQALLDEAMKTNLNQSDYDVRYYGIDISLDFGNASISGQVDYQIVAKTDGFSTVDLDFDVNMSVTSVIVDGMSASFSHVGPDDLIITTPTTYNNGDEFEMTVYYNGFPSYIGQQGMDFANIWGYNMCWTNCEPWGSRYWWPCKDTPTDKPDSVDVIVEYPSGYRLMSLGELVSDNEIGGSRRQAHWKHMYPVATYLLAITCAQFNTAIDDWNYGDVDMPIYTYSLPNSPSFSEFRNYMPDVLTNLSNAFGLYPFATEKAGNANYGWGGAMEHQTCSFYNPGFYDEWVIAHETGHQWWGDMITCATFHHIWLNEGGASYSEPIHIEQQYGTAAYHSYMQSQKYLGSGTIYVESPQTEDIFDNNLSYDKASWVWHMLRGTIGDEAFFQFMDDWHNSEFQYGAATTSDFGNVLSASVGYDMTWWVDQWIYGDGHPEYELSWQCLPNAEKANEYELTYFVEQVQESGSYFTMPVRTIFETTGANLDTTIWYGPATLFQHVFADSVTNVIIDPEEWVLRTYQYAPFSFHLATVQLPEGYLGVEYAETLQVVGGVPPFTWSKLSGDLPIGTFFDYENGILYGTPSWKSTYYFTMQVTDSDSPPSVDQRAYSLSIVDPPPMGERGDANGDELVNITDAVYLIDFIFAGGPAPDPEWTGDANCDDLVNITDVVYLIQYIFNGGPAPGCP